MTELASFCWLLVLHRSLKYGRVPTGICTFLSAFGQLRHRSEWYLNCQWSFFALSVGVYTCLSTQSKRT